MEMEAVGAAGAQLLSALIVYHFFFFQVTLKNIILVQFRTLLWSLCSDPSMVLAGFRCSNDLRNM